jgi:hypothetical protein
MWHGARRRVPGTAPSTFEVGVLRRVLKQFKLWHLVGEDYKPLPEPKDIGRALSPEQELRLFSVASSRPEWTVAFWVSLVTAAREGANPAISGFPKPLPTGWFKRVSAATSFYAAFRPLFSRFAR